MVCLSCAVACSACLALFFDRVSLWLKGLPTAVCTHYNIFDAIGPNNVRKVLHILCDKCCIHLLWKLVFVTAICNHSTIQRALHTNRFAGRRVVTPRSISLTGYSLGSHQLKARVTTICGSVSY